MIKLPDDISSEEAAGLLAKGLTAWALLKRVHPVSPGETVVVQGASGGVGSLVARWAKSIGARVIATVGSASKISTVKRWGLDHVLHIAEPRLAEQIRALTAGVGADVVYDLVGRQTLDSSIEALRAGGVLVHAGNASGAVTADTQRLAARSIRYQQPATPQYVTPQNQDVAASELFERYREGALGPLTLTRYRLEEAAEAHHAIIQRKHSGSILLML